MNSSVGTGSLGSSGGGVMVDFTRVVGVVVVVAALEVSDCVNKDVYFVFVGVVSKVGEVGAHARVMRVTKMVVESMVAGLVWFVRVW